MGKHGFFYRGPITLLEPLVVLIGRHKDMFVKISQTRTGERVKWLLGQGRNWVIGSGDVLKLGLMLC